MPRCPVSDFEDSLRGYLNFFFFPPLKKKTDNSHAVKVIFFAEVQKKKNAAKDSGAKKLTLRLHCCGLRVGGVDFYASKSPNIGRENHHSISELAI